MGAIGAANLAAGRSSHTSVVHDMALALLNVRLLSPLRRFLALLVLVCRAGRTDSPRLPHALLTFCPCRGCSWPECSCQQPVVARRECSCGRAQGIPEGGIALCTGDLHYYPLLYLQACEVRSVIPVGAALGLPPCAACLPAMFALPTVTTHVELPISFAHTAWLLRVRVL